MSAQNRRTAAAARASGVYILLLIEDHHTAVLMLRLDIDTLFLHQIIQKPASDTSQISGKNNIIVIHTRPCRP